MSTDGSESNGGLYGRLPFGVKLGFAVIALVYGAAILTDTIEDPIPSDVWAVVYFAVAGGLLLRAVRLHRQS
ncbi:hypothetical protein [Natronoarchaeum rubrum]|uniref:hypothetical protein n=1 Tax=Natronoarchaeum rubrum TaxID=755311 RepID=UPI002112F3BA|nr:hypothetical protein [Natronoarchaeum rubrum]